MKKFVLFSLLLSGCAGEALETTPTKNSNYQVDFLFENNGCKVYRFSDAGHYIYYVDVRGSTDYPITRSTGKSSHTDYHNVQSD